MIEWFSICDFRAANWFLTRFCKKCSLFILYTFKGFVKCSNPCLIGWDLLDVSSSLKSHEKLEKCWMHGMESNSDNGTGRKKVGEMTGVLFTMYKFVQII